MRLCVIVACGDGLMGRRGQGGVELDDANVRGRATCVVVLDRDVGLWWLWSVDGDERLRFESKLVRGNEGRRSESSI